MNEKGANIDLLFRNGLKDFEVLPPPEVWDGVHSAVKIKSRPVILLKVAAVATVLLTISFLTYQLSREISDTPSGTTMAFNIPAPSPVIPQTYDNPQYFTSVKTGQVENFTRVSAETSDLENLPHEIETVQSPEQNIYLQKTKSLLLSGRDKPDGLSLTRPDESVKISSGINYQAPEYSPELISVRPQNRWSVAAMASPTYYSSFNSGSDELSKQLAASEQPLISYSGGVAFSYKISKRFSIQSGLYYSSLGQKVDGINSFGGFQKYEYTKGGRNFEVLTSSGTVYTNNPDVFLIAEGSDRVLTAYTIDVFDPEKASLQPINNSLSQNFSYLELPVVLRYKIVDKTIGINLIGGFSYNLLVNNSVYTTVDGNRYSVGRTEGLNPLMLSSSLGMGMEYNISHKLSLNLEPTFRYFLNPFSVTGSFIHPYSFGIFSGVSYKF